jgi:succinate-semialdehyde dehydrogenase / glutarate-semialdehyde dehydrogenase
MASTTAIPPTIRGYRTINPATGELLGEFATLSDTEAEALLARAHTAYGVWRQTQAADRAVLLGSFAEVVAANTDRLARQVTEEMGKPLSQAVREVGAVGAMCRYYADNGERLLADEETQIAGFAKAVTRRESVGVVLGIEPWNGPLYQAMRAAAPNLMLGNTVVVKPSEISAASTLLLDELFAEAGFPAHVYQSALISTSQVSAYIADSRIRAITLTGSDRAGAAVGEQAGREVKPAVLELGGSDAFIVLDSADVTKAASTAVACRLELGGQVCISPKRMIVTEHVADAFISRVTAGFTGQTLGDPLDPSTTIGPLSSETAAAILQEQYQDAVDKGATVLVPGGRVDGPGAYFQPAVLTDLTPEMRIYTEEAFGPLAMIYRVVDADEAIALANSSSYGLGGTVFAEDCKEALRVAGQLDTGGVGINSFLGAPIEIPFGGTKRSGFGRELGRSGMDQFANIKTYGIS